MSFPKPHYVETDALRIAVYEEGEGFPVILCHGFPEIAYSWRRQLPALAKAGFRAIAPDQRGFGKTGAPKNAPSGEAAVPLYDMENLTADLVNLLDALELPKAVFCGHDWGGIVAWQMPLRHPDRVAGIIGVNTPFIPRLTREPIAAMREAYGDEMYIVFFQKYGEAEKILEEDVARSVRFWYRTPISRAEYDKLPAEAKNLAFMKRFRADEATWGGESLLTPEEQAVYREAYEATGYEGGINWYRNFTRNWERSAHIEDKARAPSLMISAADDIVLTPEMAEGMEKYVPDLEKHIIADCGHWTQQERPDELNRLMTDWLTRRRQDF